MDSTRKPPPAGAPLDEVLAFYAARGVPKRSRHKAYPLDESGEPEPLTQLLNQERHLRRECRLQGVEFPEKLAGLLVMLRTILTEKVGTVDCANIAEIRRSFTRLDNKLREMASLRKSS